jgi:NitT/TauT family transport system ATP-binding protein
VAISASGVKPERDAEGGSRRSSDVCISTQNIGMVFNAGKQTSVTALADVSFTIDRGRFVSILGPSGCGKSTLLMILAGLARATQGVASIDGRVVTGPSPNLGMVFQRDLLLEWRTVLDNVLLQIELRGLRRRDYRARAEELLEMVGLDAFKNHRPKELSGGMRQRVAICRALVHSPRILLMDEPFGALDALTREQLNLDVGRLSSEYGATTIFVTHSIEEAVFLADEVLIFSKRPGRLVKRLEISIPRPRGLADKKDHRFSDHVAVAREVFEREGVLHDARATSP